MKARVPGMQKGGANRADMLKKVQQMQQDMESLQADLDEREYTNTAGGMVEATVNGKHEVKLIKINPDAVDKDDVEMLEDLITVAINGAIDKAKQASESEMGNLTSGLNIPGMPGLF